MDYTYGLSTLQKLGTLPIGTWYPFDSKNHIKEELLELVKLRIDLSGDFKISEDYKYFKRIDRPSAKQEIPNTDEITYKLEWREDTGQVTEKELNLPDPKLKYVDHKQWEKLKGRA